ncbi:hypothetical protein Y032_0075g956 [Ancylostoma ceylanicum]|uniref:Uncharacterized protein n=1 Tax=Ancylostoma ceylanicum TaxID=53326 RepID=A0A016TV03_9BILA|nr:hypothetical protein Y032_0075g956 [Ancylostoma ceylanicum]
MSTGVTEYAEHEYDNHFAPNYRFIDFIDFSPFCPRSAYSHENWIFVTVLSRDRRNNMIELDTRSIMKECFSDFMISTCHGDNIGVSTNSEDIMMAGFTSPL